MSWLAWTLVAFASPPATVVFFWQQARPWRYYRAWAVLAAAFTILYADLRDWPSTAGDAASLLVALILWWLSRRKRRHGVLGLIGDKTRALLEAIVAKMPRVTSRLHPEGART